jgi:hypothetical protein
MKSNEAKKERQNMDRHFAPPSIEPVCRTFGSQHKCFQIYWICQEQTIINVLLSLLLLLTSPLNHTLWSPKSKDYAKLYFLKYNFLFCNFPLTEDNTIVLKGAGAAISRSRLKNNSMI